MCSSGLEALACPFSTKFLKSTDLRFTTSPAIATYTHVRASCFIFGRWFVGRFARAVGQTHSLPSFGLSVGLSGLAMCVAVKR